MIVKGRRNPEYKKGRMKMKETSTVLAMEVTAEEMEEVLKRRETKAKEAAIKKKADEIARLIDDIKRLGGRVTAQRDGKSTYFSTCGERVRGVRLSYSYGVEIVIT
jgi:hypothetical protein